MSNPIFSSSSSNPFGLSNVGYLASDRLVDIDGDGDLDAFISNWDGNTLFFRNTGTINNPVFAAPQTNPFGLIQVGNRANPSFVDIDGDGDQDVFVDSYDGIQFFRNTGTVKNPIFAVPQTDPFGLIGTDCEFVDIDSDGDFDAFADFMFYKNIGTAVNPNLAPPVKDTSGLGFSKPRFVDIDNDGDFDAFVGSGDFFGGGDLEFFRNIGSKIKPIFHRDGSKPFGLGAPGSYHKPSFADIDNDADIDVFISNNNGDTYFFKNMGSGNNPSFASSSSFGMDNVEFFSNSTFADIDGDGDLDGFVGIGFSYDETTKGQTLFFENTGTPKNPHFIASIANPFGLTDVGAYAKPTFADIDKDGDLDAFIGNEQGNTLFYRNTGTISSPVFAAPIINPFGLVDIGNNARPTFVDIDNDNDLDAFINNLFFKNTGTFNNPIFAAPQADVFGFNGSPSFVDADRDGDFDVFLGAGPSTFLRNVGTASNPQFLQSGISPFGLPGDELRTSQSQAYVDIDGDGDFDTFLITTNTYAGLSSTTHFLINNNAPNVTNLTASEVYSKETSLNLKDIVISDPDSANVTSTLTLSNAAAGRLSTATSGAVTSTYNAATGVWKASGALANVNLLLAGVVFTPATNFAGAFTINTSITDNVASALTASKDFTVMLVSTPGNTILTGTSSGNNTLTYASATGAVTVSLNITTQQNTGGAGLDTITAVENLIGSPFADNLTGNTTYNILDGRGGNDILRGWSGADTLIGGLGNDTLYVENLRDVVIEKLNEGSDTVSSSITYTLPANVENLILTGTAAIDGTGNSAANRLNGGAGNDTLDGGFGVNRLTGGACNDIFKFTSLGPVDVITDYNVVNDTVQLENSVFTALTVTGTLPAGQFRIGMQAADANDHIIYNSATGALIYDPNGNGAGGATQIATIGTGLSMTHADVVVI